MVTIDIKSKVKNAYTYEDGAIIYRIAKREILNNNIIELSFSEIDSIPSSFANGCFIQLLEDFSLDEIKKFVKISNSTKQINGMIKSRLTFENNRIRPEK